MASDITNPAYVDEIHELLTEACTGAAGAPLADVIPNDLATRLLRRDPEASRELRVRVQEGKRAHSVYPALWTAAPGRALQRHKVDAMMAEGGEDVDWHSWSEERLRDYIEAIRRNHPTNAYGRFCQWIGCEESRLTDSHFCATHEIVAEANK